MENIKVADRGVSTSAKATKMASAGATVAWQALAIATQQHYLVEISARLENIEQAIGHVLGHLEAADLGRLKAVSEGLALIDSHLGQDIPLDAHYRERLIDWHTQVREIAHAAVERASRDLDGREPETALKDLLVADRSAALASQCVNAILRVPASDPRIPLAEFWHYGDLTQVMLDDIADMLSRIRESYEARRQLWEHFDARGVGTIEGIWDSGPGQWGGPPPRR